MKIWQVLLISRLEHCWMLPELLARAGCVVDVVTAAPLLTSSRYVRSCFLASQQESLLSMILEKIHQPYDWIVIADDPVLQEVMRSSLSPEEKLRILPVMRPENLAHVYSRIGLARTFKEQGVLTPEFRIVHNQKEALQGGHEIGYPVLLKTDGSGGGYGIFECHKDEDIEELSGELFHQPLLLQKKLFGQELDLSALYLDGELIHFSYSAIKAVVYKFGPSYLRLYTPLHLVDKAVFEELAHLGKALGAHGFTNISCMETVEGRFYFEADMRPNVWLDYPRFLGEDLSQRIAAWKDSKIGLNYPVQGGGSSELLPYFLRLKPSEIIFNRYNVWRFIPRGDLAMRVLFKHMCPRITRLPLIKSLTPRKIKKKALKLKKVLYRLKRA